MAQVPKHPALPKLKERFGQVKLLAGSFRDMVTVVVPRESIRELCQFLRDDPELRYDMLFELHGVDYLNYPGAKHRFAVDYGLLSTGSGSRLWLKVYLDPTMSTAPGTAPEDKDVMEKGDPGLKVDSVYPVWPGADWMEREAYDMFGLIFVGHPDLRRILTWSAYGSYPLRKDYPLQGVGEREDFKIITRESA